MAEHNVRGALADARALLGGEGRCGCPETAVYLDALEDLSAAVDTYLTAEETELFGQVVDWADEVVTLGQALYPTEERVNG